MITMIPYVQSKKKLIPTLKAWNLLSHLALWPETSNPTIQHNIDEIPYSVYPDTDGFMTFYENQTNDRLEGEEYGANNVWSVVDTENKITVWFVPGHRPNAPGESTMIGPLRYSYLSGTKTLSYQNYITDSELQATAELFQEELDTTMFLYDNGEKLPKWSFYRYEPDGISFKVLNWREFPDEILY